jgi:hypothetical protein
VAGRFTPLQLGKCATAIAGVAFEESRQTLDA